MTQPPKPRSEDWSQIIVDTIQQLKTSDGKAGTLKEYPIRKLVEHAQKFGPELKRQKLETNQIRKFLDALNRLKVKLAQVDEEFEHNDRTEEEKERTRFSKIETDIVLLKPKIAYAAARQDAVKKLSKVMSAAIDRVQSTQDFYRLAQLIEATIAYHKEGDGA